MGDLFDHYIRLAISVESFWDYQYDSRMLCDIEYCVEDEVKR
jgi:hypothetical protein